MNFDGPAFVRHALECDWQEVRAWFLERLGIDHHGGKSAPRRESPPPPPKEIEWPGELVSGTVDTWKAFAARRKLSFAGVAVAVEAGVLRFLKVRGVRCYAVCDPSGKTGEIRRCDGAAFENGRKQYSLTGPAKEWPVGAGLFPDKGKGAAVLICEGASDYLAAFNAYVIHRKSGGSRSWLPLGLLGASCRKLAPELVPWFRNRTVRIAGDGDQAGRDMNEAWRGLLLDLGCAVEVVNTPEGRDLRDLLESGELKPRELFA